MLLAAASGRPDVGLVYNFKPPSTNYGVPDHYHPVPSNTYIPPPSTNIQTPYTYGGSANSLSLSSLGSRNQFGVDTLSLSSISGGSGSLTTGSFGSGSVLTGSNLASSASGSSSQFKTNAPLISKHFYFFEAPEEPQLARTKVQIPVITPRKNYKLIFIKTPTYGQSAEVIAPQQKDEEKTLVYVLVKQPDEAQKITIPPPAPTKPSKPEVFFIKYKSQQEAQEKIAEALQGSNGPVHLANTLPNEEAIVSSIGRDANAISHNSQVVVENSAANIGGIGDVRYSDQSILAVQQQQGGSSISSNSGASLFQTGSSQQQQGSNILSSADLFHMSSAGVQQLVQHPNIQQHYVEHPNVHITGYRYKK